MKRNGSRFLGPNQKKILELLTAYPDSTIMEITKLVFPDDQVKYRGKQYTSVCRSLHMLEERKLIEREGDQSIKWHVRSNP